MSQDVQMFCIHYDNAYQIVDCENNCYYSCRVMFKIYLSLDMKK